MTGRKKHNNIRYVFVCMACMFLLCGCLDKNREFESAGTAMGTVVTQKIYGSEDVTQKVLDEIVRLETEQLSKREPASQTGRINEEAGNADGTVLSEEMKGWLFQLFQISADSGGAFDVTLGPVVSLWNIDACTAGTEDFVKPSEKQIQEALSFTGYDRVILERDRIILPQGMSLDLGAAGKGIACEKVAALLRETQGITGAVVSVGGSVVTYGEKPDHSPWTIGIVNPRPENGGGNYIGRLLLTGNWFVSTSGDYERYVYWEGKRWHHIMNPATGSPAESDVISVTVLSDDGLVSDALSTACFVLGREQGFALAKKYGAELLMVDTDGNIHMTEGMKRYFIS